MSQAVFLFLIQDLCAVFVPVLLFEVTQHEAIHKSVTNLLNIRNQPEDQEVNHFVSDEKNLKVIFNIYIFSHSLIFFVASIFFCVYLCRNYIKQLFVVFDITSVLFG